MAGSCTNRKMEIFTLMVDNEFGVLTRVTALIRREGWNIRSLSVAETDDTDVSRLTVSLDLHHSAVEHVVDRLSRLGSVRDVSVFSPETQVAQELCFVRLDVKDSEALAALCADYDAQRLEEGPDSVLLSVRYPAQDTDQFLKRCKLIGLRAIARSGAIALNLAENV